MKISLLIPTVVLYVFRVAFSNFVPVGTVLFSTTDLVRKCWTESDKALLKARLIMQDVLPDPDCIDFSKPEATVILLDYFHACYQIISTCTYGKLQNLMYLALSDALGGYLRAYVLPFTRRAYYAGQMEYSEAKKLFQLYDDIKLFLKTNGVGWAGPQKVCYRKFRAKPLTIIGGSLEACDQLYTIEMDGKSRCINPCNICGLRADEVPSCFSKTSKEGFREDFQIPQFPSRPSNSTFPFSSHTFNRTTHHHFPFPNATANDSRCSHQSFPITPTHSTQETISDTGRTEKRKCRSDSLFHRKCAPVDCKRVIVPLPVLDDCGTPRAIAVPFRKRPLRNLSLRNSAFILEYYYIAVIKCFVAKGNTREDIKNFNAQFHSWLISQVFPHLNDEQWYPAFGGVLRIIQTIKKFGGESTFRDPVMHDIAYMFGKGVEFDITESPKLLGRDKVRDVADVEDCYTSPDRHYFIAILLVSLIWIFIFCICAFYCQATRGRNLLYEGCSKVNDSCQKRRIGTENQDKIIDFKFLVKFFKKKDVMVNEQQVHYCFIENEKDKKAHQGSSSHDTKSNHNFQDVDPYKQLQKLSQEARVKEKGRLVMLGQGDVPTFPMQTDKIQNHLSTWLSLGRFEEMGMRKMQRQWERQEQEQNDVQMLWRKPSVKFKRKAALKDGEKPKRRYECTRRSTTPTMRRSDEISNTSSTSCSASMEDETKSSSTEKRSSACCCSETLRHSNTTSNSSTLTQAETKLSSSTKGLFQNTPARHKPCRSSTQESTAESESVGDESYTSESDD